MSSQESKLHRCDQCDKTFTRLSNLRRHVKDVHTDNKPFQCGQCNKTFARRSHLSEHERTHSTEPKPDQFECGYCSKTFARVDHLRRHKLRVHNTKALSKTSTGSGASSGRVSCGDSGEVLHNKFQLRDHQRRHHCGGIQTGRGSASNVNSTAETMAQKRSKLLSGSDFGEDARSMPNDIYPEEMTSDEHRQVYQDHWAQIRTKHSRKNKIQDRYNFRLDNLTPNQLAIYLQKFCQEQKLIFKLNLSFGFILRNNETGEYRYYHSSVNNHRFLDTPVLITSEADLANFIQAHLDKMDVLEWARHQRPNSKWVVDIITNVTFFVSKLKGHPIGTGSKLPKFILKNKSMKALNRDHQTGKLYNDNLCFFRCLAVHNGCHS